MWLLVIGYWVLVIGALRLPLVLQNNNVGIISELKSDIIDEPEKG